MNFQDLAQHFIEEEKQFHLGGLITEKPHPKTSNLSERISKSTPDGVRNLLEVDQDIIPVAKGIFNSPAYQQLISALLGCIEKGKTVCFSSCGASGRLAIILESMWRSFWNDFINKYPESSDFIKKIENQVYSIMTGGDRALIRSVENFEDYQMFGRRQFKDSGLGKGDLLIALTEGGEISSVIGTMKEALDNKAEVFMIYNNPAEILSERFERSREMLNHPDVIKIDLTTGPMALAGSTRMQATTIAMLVVGAAMDECFDIITSTLNHREQGIQQDEKSRTGLFYPDIFNSLLEQLKKPEAVNNIAQLIDIESECYNKSGRVTYVADRYLLDIFSDTTERAPTFMVPPFRQYDDKNSPAPWAFAKDPLHKAAESWLHLLKRSPRGLNWTKADYRSMGAPPEIQDRVHSLDNEQILKFHIGKEDDPSRYNCPSSVLMRVSVNEPANRDFDAWWLDHARRYTQPVGLTIGKESFKLSDAENIHIPLNLPSTMTNLFEHLAVKIIFNTLSTVTMAKIGRIQGNWMVQLDATNKKLTDRATRIIAHFAKLPYDKACLELFQTMDEPASHRLQYKNSYIIQTLDRLGV